MKKFNKFVEDHELELSYGLGVLVGSACTAFFAYHAMRGMQVTNANLYEITETGKQFLRLEYFNGAVKDIQWETYVQP